MLSTIHPISKANRLNYHWSVYRLKLLSERFAIMASLLEKRKELLPAEDDEDGRGGSEVVRLRPFPARCTTRSHLVLILLLGAAQVNVDEMSQVRRHPLSSPH